MQIHILGLNRSENGQVSALEFVPKIPTYVIRVWSEFQPPAERERYSLQSNPNFKVIREYTFDDISPDYPHQDFSGKGTLFTSSIAERVIKDFEKDHIDCEALLVHCLLGRNRSPAVAIALNKIFKLGNDSEKLKGQYKGLNYHIYGVLLSKAKELGREFEM
ncbi:MAG: hypothetical protein Q7K43_01340 [Candidatus Woesearchaeota archaeon]|nr:hypothetical protein [Candidatus Woesearchaeota archaeon]